MTTVFTLGHSDRSFDAVLQMLRAHEVATLVDVRRFPGSKTHPQWNQVAIVEALPTEIGYTWIAELGGRRYTKVGAETRNGWWKVKAFRDYADHMGSDEFAHGLQQLLDLARSRTAAIMCSEAVPWRCHRRLITDALLVSGVEVQHIISTSRTESAVLNAALHVRDAHLEYPA